MGNATKLSLAEVLSKHQGEGAADRIAARDTYLARIAGLHWQLRQWLKPSIEQKLAAVAEAAPVVLSDEGVEPYEAPVLFLNVGPRRIRFVPVGFFVIGADGRVDLEAGDRAATLVLRGDTWYFAHRQPKVELIALDESSFTEAVEELLGG